MPLFFLRQINLFNRNFDQRLFPDSSKNVLIQILGFQLFVGMRKIDVTEARFILLSVADLHDCFSDQ